MVGEFHPGFLPIDPGPIAPLGWARGAAGPSPCAPGACADLPERGPTDDPRRAVEFSAFLLRSNLSQAEINLPAADRGMNRPSSVRDSAPEPSRARGVTIRFEDASAARLSDRPAIAEQVVRRTFEKIVQVRQPARLGWTIDLYA